MNEPIGRAGFFRSARLRRSAREIIPTALSCPITDFFSSSSMRSSLALSPSSICCSGTPVSLATTAAMSLFVISVRVSAHSFFQLALDVAPFGGGLEILLDDRGLFLRLGRFDVGFDRSGVRRRDHAADPGARPCFIHHVDRLVRQESPGDVPVGEPDRRFERAGAVFDMVVLFVGLLESVEDFDRILDARRIDHHRLEAPLQRRVLFDPLAVFVEGGRADALQFAARQRGLDDVGRIHRAFGAAGPDDGVQLVDEQNHLFRVADLIDHRRSSNWPRYLVPATISGRSIA